MKVSPASHLRIPSQGERARVEQARDMAIPMLRTMTAEMLEGYLVACLQVKAETQGRKSAIAFCQHWGEKLTISARS